MHLLGFIFQSKYKENGQIIKKLLKNKWITKKIKALINHEQIKNSIFW
jgi:hypothetical protein